jgi:Putative restriction endonuclease
MPHPPASRPAPGSLPVLAADARSLRDLNLKKAAYERFGIPSYWVVDPDLERPSLRAFELDGDSYTVVADVTGSEKSCARQPFSVEIVPERLVAKLRRSSPGRPG